MGAARAQIGSGSTSIDNSTVIISPGTVQLQFAENLFFGPNTFWIIHGTLEIWSANIWIAPTARFSGTGKIIIHDPETNPFYSGTPPGPTRIDGNDGTPINVAVELRNPNNLVLEDIPDPGFGISLPPGGPQAAALRLNNSFTFAVDFGDILLNGNDLYIGDEGSFINYNHQRMIVTDNSVSGHVVKTFRTGRPFTFPVGIAEGDYTPATLSPSGTTSLYVSVQDYAASSATVTQPRDGMDRVWHIYADKPVYASYTLQHNSITNGSAFVDASAQIVHYAGSGNWIGGNTRYVATGTHARNWVAALTATADHSWLTKLVSGNLGPQANNDTAQGASGAGLNVAVLGNDLPGSSPISVSSVRVVLQPSHGSVTVNHDGSITYVSNRRYVGSDSFVYEITDGNGLKDIATVTLAILNAGLVIPNAVTPNGDGKNDFFFIQGLSDYDSADLTIFNRWGNEVYRSLNYQQNWSGEGLNEGTYYYRLVLRKRGEETIHKGWVLVKK